MRLSDLRRIRDLFSKASINVENLLSQSWDTEEIISDGVYRVVFMSSLNQLILRGEKTSPGEPLQIIISKEYEESEIADLEALKAMFKDFGDFLISSYTSLEEEKEGKTFIVFESSDLSDLYKQLNFFHESLNEGKGKLNKFKHLDLYGEGKLNCFVTLEDFSLNLRFVKEDTSCLCEFNVTSKKIDEEDVDHVFNSIAEDIREELLYRGCDVMPYRQKEETPPPRKETKEKEVEKKEIKKEVKEVEKKKVLTEAVRYNKGKIRFDLIPPEFIKEIAEVFTFGAQKYAADNWKGFDKKQQEEIKASLLRHIYSYLEGEELDPESGLHHLAHAGCNLAFLAYFRNKRN